MALDRASCTHDKPLAEILGSEFFQAIRRRRPYSPNYFRPCLVLDHPQILRQVVGECGAHPTHPDADSLLTKFSEDLDRYALTYGKMADALWEEQNRLPLS